MSALALAMMLTGAVAVSNDDAQPRLLPGEKPEGPGFQLTLGPHGRIARCVVTRPRGALDFGPDPCEVLRARARSEAARFGPPRDPVTAFLCDADTGEFAWRRRPAEDRPAAGICPGAP